MSLTHTHTHTYMYNLPKIFPSLPSFHFVFCFNFLVPNLPSSSFFHASIHHLLFVCFMTSSSILCCVCGNVSLSDFHLVSFLFSFLSLLFVCGFLFSLSPSIHLFMRGRERGLIDDPIQFTTLFLLCSTSSKSQIRTQTHTHNQAKLIIPQ